MATSCQKQSFDDAPMAPQSAQSRSAEELLYLDFTEDFRGVISSPCDSNAIILTMAIDRVKILQKENRWGKGTNLSAIDLNMSIAVFEYVCRIVDRSDLLLQEILENAALGPRTRIFGEPILEIEIQQTDCFARCMGYMANYLCYSDVSYSGVNSFVNQWYGNGIPQDQVLPTMQYFYGRNNVSSISAGRLQNVDMSQSGVMLTYTTGGSNGHAVVYISTANDGSYNVYDVQQNRIDNIGTGCVTGIYHVLKSH